MEERTHWYEQVELTDEPSPSNRQGRWRVAVVAGISSLAVTGAVAGFALTSGPGTSAGAAGQATTTTVANSQDEGKDDPSRSSEDWSRKRAEKRKERLEEALKPLVDDGTITEKQRDAVIEQLLKSIPQGGPYMGRPGHHAKRGEHWGPRGPRGFFGEKIEAAASALGISLDELRDLLRDGKSIADIAEEKGVDIDKVVDALVKAAEEALDALDLPEGVDVPTSDELRGSIEAFIDGAFRGGPRHRGSDTTTTTVK